MMRSVLFAIIPSVCMLVTPSTVVQAATQTEAIFVDASSSTGGKTWWVSS